MIALLTACGLLLGAPPACQPHVIEVTAHNQRGPTCLVAAGLTAASAHTTEVTSVRALARELPVWPDGVDGYDLAVAMERRGWKALLFTGPPEAAARLVEAGFPVVALVTQGRRVHAVTVHGVQREAADSGACDRGLERLLVLDPGETGSRWEPAQTLAARQSAERMILFYRPEDDGRLDAKGFPLAIARHVDRRLRAQALVRRAAEHPQANTQSLALLRQAHDLDPCGPRVRQLLHQTLIRLNRPSALPALAVECEPEGGETTHDSRLEETPR